MKNATHVRQGRYIKNLETNEVVDYKTVNAAKRRSREMQRGGQVLRNGRL